MKQLSLLITILLVLGCKSKGSDSFLYMNKQKFRIVKSPMMVNNDTIMIKELRFYRISSARNSGQVIYDKFGDWNRETNSFFGGYRTHALIWDNINLLDDENLFSIICDGTESEVGYFSSIMIFDAAKNNCLESDHPHYNAVIAKVTQMMKERQPNREFYKRTLLW
jgi:hypothetical protein